MPKRNGTCLNLSVDLQNMRYHDSISFISDIPDELLEYSIPKLTLQPIVENSVLHGILETDDQIRNHCPHRLDGRTTTLFFLFPMMVSELLRKNCPTILVRQREQYFRRNQHCNLQYAPTSSDSVRTRLRTYLFQRARSWYRS